MKIKEIRTQNYRGKNFDLKPAKINLFFAKNGTGKTSLCDAIRYAITGLIPPDNLRSGAVQVIFENGMSIQRARGRSTVCGINGKKVTETAMNAAIADMIGLPVQDGRKTDALKDVKIACSSDVLLHLSPADFSKLLMQYIPETLDLERMLVYFEDQPDAVKNECRKAFPGMPEKFGMKKVQEVYMTYYNNRKETNVLLKEKTAAAKNLNPVEPKRSIDTINEELANLLANEKNQTGLVRRQAEYVAAKKKRDMQEAEIKRLKEMIKQVPEKPDDDFDAKLDLKRAAAEKMIVEQTAQANGIQLNIEFYEKAIASLELPICPISEKLVCTTDKTQIRAEMEAMLKKNMELLKNAQKIIQDAEAKKDRYIQLKQENEQKKKAYAEYTSIMAKIDMYEKNLVILPEDPGSSLTQPEDASRKKAVLEAEKKNAEDYTRKQALLKEAQQQQNRYNLETAMIRALEDKGPVKTKIIEYYLQQFEGVCNARAQQFAPGYAFKFHPDNGVRIYVKAPAKNRYYPLECCSSGEKILATFILMDMVNQLTGARLMLVDNTEALDIEHMKALRKLLETPEFTDEYDHIFICGVNHIDVMQAFRGMKDAALISSDTANPKPDETDNKKNV